MASLNSRASVSATLERISSTGDDVSRILNQGGNIDTAIDLLRAAIANLTRISNSIDAVYTHQPAHQPRTDCNWMKSQLIIIIHNK